MASRVCIVKRRLSISAFSFRRISPHLPIFLGRCVYLYCPVLEISKSGANFCEICPLIEIDNLVTIAMQHGEFRITFLRPLEPRNANCVYIATLRCVANQRKLLAKSLPRRDGVVSAYRNKQPGLHRHEAWRIRIKKNILF